MAKLIRISTAAIVLLSFATIGCTQKDAETVPAPTVAAEPAPAAEPAAEVAAQPDAATRYDGKLVRQPPGAGGKEDGWYLVKDGQRRWISNADWLGQNGYTPESVIEISSEEFQSIPEDPMPLGE
ncbi:MAG: hypothetical protein NT117_05095 [Gammaproteobacteria bacterium]|nr:hypothetical protein [Gammaproteobacteria bacterium]